jgi:hypothetical protein
MVRRQKILKPVRNPFPLNELPRSKPRGINLKKPVKKRNKLRGIKTPIGGSNVNMIVIRIRDFDLENEALKSIGCAKQFGGGMKRILCLSLFLVFFCSSPLWAGSLQCSKYHVSLEGKSYKVPGYVCKDILEMHKVDQSAGYDGKWKVDRLVQVIECPSGGAEIYLPPGRLDMRGGMWMMCEYQVVGNIIVADCKDGNFYLDVYKNKIGIKPANKWMGKIKGQRAEYNLHPDNPLAFTMAGDIRKSEHRQLDIDIVAPTNDKFVFNDQKPGVLEMEFRAKVSPSEYEGDVIWEVPKIEGSTMTMQPASGKGPTLKVRYEGLPSDNSQFGPKTVQALVNVGGCKAYDSKEVKVFYNRDAKNNPGGDYPNWFYYWKQTPAGKPKNQIINIKYGGTTVQNCTQANCPAFYQTGDHATIYVCDLAKLGPTFATTFPLLYLTPPYYKGLTTTTQIDTFAVAVRHEFEHWIVEHNYRGGKTPAEFEPWDKDNDGLPDAMEHKWGFDKTKRQTFLANHNVVKNVEEDEEWLAYMSMREIVPGSLDKHDWARPGKQWP